MQWHPMGRTIVIVPNKSLVTQTEKDYINMQQDVGVYFGDRKEWGRQHTICTWQSLNVLLKEHKEFSGRCHHWRVLRGCGMCYCGRSTHGQGRRTQELADWCYESYPLRWGLTGTIPKEPFEFQALKCSLGPVIGKLSASELQSQGVLAQCHVNIVQLVDHAEFTNYQSELKFSVRRTRQTRYHCWPDPPGQCHWQYTCVGGPYCSRTRPYRTPGRQCCDGVGCNQSKARQDEYDEVADATGKIIVATYGVAAVGINIPRIFNLVLVEPGKSFVRVIQSIGRGIRKAEDKDHVQIWDVTSTCKFAKRHLTKRKVFYREANYPFTQEKLEWK
jgi:superfamily II DNA or RNA helicase